MTRYPKGGKGKKWTIHELNSASPDWKGDTLNDGGGLSGDVRVTAGKVSVSFRLAFKWQGKVAWHYCGIYPANDMSTIRGERDNARDLIKAGIDPRLKKVATRIEAQAAVVATVKAEEQQRTEALTFNDLYQTWIRDGVSRADGNDYIIRTFKKHALPSLGKIELRHLTEHDLRDVYRAIIAAGKTPTAVELSKDIGQMLRWGEKRKPWRALMIDGNPSELVEVMKLVANDYTKERTRQLSIEEIVKLHTIFTTMNQNYADAPKKYEAERPMKQEAQIALWLCLGTLCRIGELLMTEWKHVNLEQRTWFIPAANTKGQRGKKRDQLVYLSDFTHAKFSQLHALTGDRLFAFPAKYNEGHVCIKTISKQVGDRQVKFKSRTRKLQLRVENNSLVVGDMEWTPHDLRRTGSTMMQKLKINGIKVSREVVNLCQNHVIGSMVDRVYLLDDYADEKRVAWEKLGDRIEAILSSSNVVSLKAA